jgi:DNA-directed RNA polymerase I, II, and III subunit RPABC2
MDAIKLNEVEDIGSGNESDDDDFVDENNDITETDADVDEDIDTEVEEEENEENEENQENETNEEIVEEDDETKVDEEESNDEEYDEDENNDENNEIETISSDDSDGEEAYLFDEDYKTEAIETTHTLLKVNNMHEIKALSIVTRNPNNIIVDENHKSLPILTKYEKAKILGIRANQINNGCKTFVDTNENDIDGYLIAEKELYAKKIPLIIKRPLPSGENEYWHVRDLELII